MVFNLRRRRRAALDMADRFCKCVCCVWGFYLEGTRVGRWIGLSGIIELDGIVSDWKGLIKKFEPTARGFQTTVATIIYRVSICL